MITNEKLPQTAIFRSTLEINKILFAADRHAMLTAYYRARAFIRALYDEDEGAFLDGICSTVQLSRPHPLLSNA
ncbi:hypothetical protein [Pseudomonas sp. P108]|uniref:hypothetical protein n=1 Tax=Pseudomonas sp. P108 TaxID=1837993 RepID=UPI002935145C|nr:hypothetical protein [Pseudomonas sp. P108]WNZ87430.1 hypothetical protein QOM10_29545 [Pseudomonas sp. P108]